MAAARKITVKHVGLYERDTRLRLPFRFGIVTLREAPQMFVELEIEDERGGRAIGYAADVLAPKWFDKNPRLDNEDNFEQLRRAVMAARRAYLASGPATAFALFADNYAAQMDVAADQRLVASFGQALLDRAVMDALCRLERVVFPVAVRENRAGMTAHDVVPDLAGEEISAFLKELMPASRIAARHTVGLLDPLDRNPEPVGDGLPETLEQVVETYAHQYYKLKVGGDLEADIDRLSAIAGILERRRPDFLVTLDGNEQYADADAFLAFLERLQATPRLAGLMERVLYIEQPIARAESLSRDVSAIGRLRPVIIDESDDSLDAFPAAMTLGYRGVSTKSCKGLYKSLVNLLRCRKAGPEFFLSAEDLTMQAGIAVQQDLALVSLLGLKHVERNGHHYVNGLASVGRAEQKRFLAMHPDLYRDVNGAVRLHIFDGALSISSLNCPGFASAALPDVSTMRRVA